MEINLFSKYLLILSYYISLRFYNQNIIMYTIIIDYIILISFFVNTISSSKFFIYLLIIIEEL